MILQQAEKDEVILKRKRLVQRISGIKLTGGVGNLRKLVA